MKKRNIVHSALSLSLTAALCLSMAACGGTQTPADSSAASAAPAQPAAVQPAAEEPTSTALPVKALHPKQVDENPYMAKSHTAQRRNLGFCPVDFLTMSHLCWLNLRSKHLLWS